MFFALVLEKEKPKSIPKDEILKAYNKDKTNNIKEKIAEYALNLTISYLTLLKDFCIRSRAMERTNINSLMERLSQNTRKLNFAQDPEMDEKMDVKIQLLIPRTPWKVLKVF